MKRRTLLAGTAAAGIAGLSGCLSTLLGGVTNLKAAPGAISQSALDSTGYESAGIEEVVTEREVDVAGQSEVVAVTNYLTSYEKQVGIDGIAEQPTATVAVFSTPQLEVAGRTLNPVADMSSREIVELIGDSYDRIDNIEEDASETVTILGQSVTKTRFVAEASFAGIPIELDLHVTEAVERDDDLLLVVGIYPRLLRSVEADNLRQLAVAVSDEPADTTGESGDGDTANSDGDSGESNTTDRSDGSTENGTTDGSGQNESSDGSLGGINVTVSLR